MDKFLDLFFRGGQITGLGMIAVFAVIAVIFVVIKSIGAAAGSDKKAVAKEEATETKEPDPAPAPVPAPAEEADDSELIAILAAAVSAYCGEPVTKFRVVSFKHIK